MGSIFNVAQIIVSILIIASILMQQRGSGLSGVFGGGGNVYQTKRGLDKFLFYVTIALAIIFIGSALFRILYQI